jgi:hypothetical protein
MQQWRREGLAKENWGKLDDLFPISAKDLMLYCSSATHALCFLAKLKKPLPQLRAKAQAKKSPAATRKPMQRKANKTHVAASKTSASKQTTKHKSFASSYWGLD